MTPRQALHNERLEIAYQELCRAANAKEVGPTNIELSKICGYLEGDCGAGASNLLQTLVRDGRIRILPAATHGRRRLVEILATGAITANPTAGTNKIKREATGRALRAGNSKAQEKYTIGGQLKRQGVPKITLTTFNDPRLIAALAAR